MRLINYTRCVKREHKLYSIMGISFPNGYTVSQVTIVLYPIVSSLIGFLLSKITHLNLYTLDTTLGMIYILFWLTLGGMIGISMNFVEVKNYKLGEYLRAYFSKKTIITTNQDLKEHMFVKDNILVDTIVRSEV